jgi:hypothetical protein
MTLGPITVGGVTVGPIELNDMTVGEMMFCGGVALLGLTVLLAIVFAIKKPKYRPQNLTGEAVTEPVRNDFPTQKVTREAAAAAATEFVDAQTGAEAATEFMAQPDAGAATEFMAADDPASLPTEMMETAETEYLRQ